MTRRQLVILLLTTACHSALTLAPEPCDQECIIERLADLELKQRVSDAENLELREIMSQQKSTIELQARRIDTLEETILALKQAAPTQPITKPQIQEVEPESEAIDATDDAILTVDNSKQSWPKRRVDKKQDNAMTKTKRQERNRVAFSTYLDHDVTVSNQQTIKPNRIITNEGNGYNNNTGIFTCPEAGMYLLTYFIGERDTRGIWVKLLINSVDYVDATVDTAHPSQDLQGGNAVIVRLNAGDAVWLESEVNNGHVEGGTGGNRFTSFSGVFLYP